MPLIHNSLSYLQWTLCWAIHVICLQAPSCIFQQQTQLLHFSVFPVVKLLCQTCWIPKLGIFETMEPGTFFTLVYIAAILREGAGRGLLLLGAPGVWPPENLWKLASKILHSGVVWVINIEMARHHRMNLKRNQSHADPPGFRLIQLQH